jgi:hypothetical protein
VLQCSQADLLRPFRQLAGQRDGLLDLQKLAVQVGALGSENLQNDDQNRK